MLLLDWNNVSLSLTDAFAKAMLKLYRLCILDEEVHKDENSRAGYISPVSSHGASRTKKPFRA